MSNASVFDAAGRIDFVEYFRLEVELVSTYIQL